MRESGVLQGLFLTVGKGLVPLGEWNEVWEWASRVPFLVLDVMDIALELRQLIKVWIRQLDLWSRDLEGLVWVGVKKSSHKRCDTEAMGLEVSVFLVSNKQFNSFLIFLTSLFLNYRSLNYHIVIDWGVAFLFISTSEVTGWVDVPSKIHLFI